MNPSTILILHGEMWLSNVSKPQPFYLHTTLYFACAHYTYKNAYTKYIKYLHPHWQPTTLVIQNFGKSMSRAKGRGHYIFLLTEHVKITWKLKGKRKYIKFLKVYFLCIWWSEELLSNINMILYMYKLNIYVYIAKHTCIILNVAMTTCCRVSHIRIVK
jgi:hypothetical protein